MVEHDASSVGHHLAFPLSKNRKIQNVLGTKLATLDIPRSISTIACLRRELGNLVFYSELCTGDCMVTVLNIIQRVLVMLVGGR